MTFLTRKLMYHRLKHFLYLNVWLWQIVKNETSVILWFSILFFSHSRWDSGLVYWHQHNQSLWNHLLVTTLRNKKRRLDSGSWFFLVYSSSSIYLFHISVVFIPAYKILYLEKCDFLFTWNKCNFLFCGTYVLILN